MSQGNIISWKKKEGDSIQPGDIYCEVETDKATIEWEAQEEGFLARILVGEGAKGVEVGTPVAVIVEEEENVAAFKDYTPVTDHSTKTEEKQSETPKPSASKPAAASLPSHEVLSMPALSPTMSQGNIIAWKKAVGDTVQPGDILAEVETDKATIEWEAQEEGVIAKLLVPEGSNGIAVGTPVLVTVDDQDSIGAFESWTPDQGAETSGQQELQKPEEEAGAATPSRATPSPATPSAAAPMPSARTASGGRVIASPYAKKLASQGGVSLQEVQGSGPGGRIVAADVQGLLSSAGAPSAAGQHAAPAGGAPQAAQRAIEGEYTDIPTSQIRQVIARRLLESKQQIPHYYLTVACRIDKLMSMRAGLNENLASSSGGKLSVNDFIIKASALALKKVPEVNASWYGDFIRQYNYVDCSVAVQTPTGLMVPIVKNADAKGLATIAAEVKELAEKAKAGKLKPEEFTGGTFTVSNLGMFGVTQFAAIVNPPQAAILAVGGAEKRVVVAQDGGYEEATFMNVTLSCDHRVVDGAVGAQWLQAFKAYVEDPVSMLL